MVYLTLYYPLLPHTSTAHSSLPRFKQMRLTTLFFFFFIGGGSRDKTKTKDDVILLTRVARVAKFDTAHSSVPSVLRRCLKKTQY